MDIIVEKKPPTLKEIREGLRALQLEADMARMIFAGRLELDPRGKTWGYDALRKKVTNAIGSIGSGWDYDFDVPDAIAQGMPRELAEAIFFHGAMRSAVDDIAMLLSGASQLPGVVEHAPWAMRLHAVREKLQGLLDRMGGDPNEASELPDDVVRIYIEPLPIDPADVAKLNGDDPKG